VPKAKKPPAATRPLPAAAQAAANEWALRYFARTYDPTWRAVLIEGLWQLARERDVLAARAAQVTQNDGYQADDYVHGAMPRGLAATGVNELAMHCEDLFALLRVLHHRGDFAHEVLGYSAGQVTRLGRLLAGSSDGTLRRAFFIPQPDALRAGLQDANDPPFAVAAAELAVATLVADCRAVAAWYPAHEQTHSRYKHGLQVHLGGFGPLPPETLAENRDATSASVVTMTNRPLGKHSESDVLMFEVPAAPQLQAHLGSLYERSLLLRLEVQRPRTEMAELARLAWVVAGLQAVLLVNRLNVLNGPDEHGWQTLQLPHTEAGRQVVLSWDTTRSPAVSYETRL
jgi:hypothetical protein